MKITLPPMPFHPDPHTYAWTDAEVATIRARDIEVARLVLEAAAKIINPPRYANEADRSIAWDHYNEIRALEVGHHD